MEGWRSTAVGLGSKVIRMMGEIFGTRPEDVVVGIGALHRALLL